MQHIEIGSRLNLLLYTRNPESGQLHWVARIHPAIKEKDGICFDEQSFMLTDFTIVRQGILPAQHTGEAFLEVLPSVFNNEQDSFDLPLGLGITSADANNDDEEDTKVPGTIRKQHKAMTKELDNLHRKLQIAFARYLRKNFAGCIVNKEKTKLANDTRIDIYFKSPEEEVTFFEIKTYPNVLTSIRVAVGQLLEYCYFPAQQLANRLVIVSHLKAGPSEQAYLAHLATILPIPFSYIAFDHEKNIVLQELKH